MPVVLLQPRLATNNKNVGASVVCGSSVAQSRRRVTASTPASQACQAVEQSCSYAWKNQAADPVWLAASQAQQPTSATHFGLTAASDEPNGFCYQNINMTLKAPPCHDAWFPGLMSSITLSTAELPCAVSSPLVRCWLARPTTLSEFQIRNELHESIAADATMLIHQAHAQAQGFCGLASQLSHDSSPTSIAFGPLQTSSCHPCAD